MRRRLLSVFLPFALVSCGDEEIRTYRVATDPASETAEKSVSEVAPAVEAHRDQAEHSGAVTWQAPSDWKTEAPGQFLTAAYSLPDGGRVTVSKLGGEGGGLAANINRWRGQVGLEPLPDDEVAGKSMAIEGSGDELLLFNLAPETPSDDTEGILAAVLPLKTETWYFKFTAPSAALKKSGDSFAEFLKTVRTAESSPTQAPPPASAEIKFSAPDDWKASEGSVMRAASFAIAGEDGGTADISVIPLPGNPGSIAENLNLWRTQLQLDPLDSPQAEALGRNVESPSGAYFFVHMVSTKLILNGKTAAISAAILKRPDKTWFFKISGEAALVEANLGKFEEFVRSATFP